MKTKIKWKLKKLKLFESICKSEIGKKMKKMLPHVTFDITLSHKDEKKSISKPGLHFIYAL